MFWRPSHRADKRALPLADSHYSRQKLGTSQFVAPGKPIVLLTPNADAVWVSLFQKPEFTDHAYPGFWVCSMFRNQSRFLSSDLITEAISITRWQWGDSELGMVTFVDPRKIQGFVYRTKEGANLSWGYCFQKVGFEEDGWTDSGKLVLRLKPERMPAALPVIGSQIQIPFAPIEGAQGCEFPPRRERTGSPFAGIR
jgi:hypothetical protein